MVIGTRPRRKPQEKVECLCGAMIARTGQLMHEASKAHRAWAEAQVVDLTVDAVAEVTLTTDPNRERIQAMVQEGRDPRGIAKTVREIFAGHDWPDEDHPGDVVQCLRENGVPILQLPRHLDPSGANTYTTNWLMVLKSSGWGKETWNVRDFESNWSAFLVELEAVAKRAEEARNG